MEHQEKYDLVELMRQAEEALEQSIPSNSPSSGIFSPSIQNKLDLRERCLHMARDFFAGYDLSTEGVRYHKAVDETKLFDQAEAIYRYLLLGKV